MINSSHPDEAQTGVDAVSVYGPFPKSREPKVIAAILHDLVRDDEDPTNGDWEEVLTSYRKFVLDDERLSRAEQMRKVVYDKGVVDDLGGLIEVLYFAGRQGLLRKYSLKFPAYNVFDQFFVGSTVPMGPRLEASLPALDRTWRLFGREIKYPIGIPASVLTSNFEWLQYFFNLGFSVLTTRTVRSGFRDANPTPNWVMVPSVSKALPIESPFPAVVADSFSWVDAGSADVTTSNSFGVPSYEPDYWMRDLSRSLRHLEHGQVLIASVMGDGPPGDRAALIDDFVQVAKMAESCGAEFIELNLSCPNTAASTDDGVKPPLCYDLPATVEVVSRVRSALESETGLVLKLSYLDYESLDALIEVVGPHIAGVAGINTVQATVIDSSGQPTFGARKLAGVSGIAVRNFGIDFVRSLARIRLERDLSFEILGMGGVTDASSFETMWEAGASVVMSASGVFANPFLAETCMREIGSKLAPGVSEHSALWPPVVRRVESVTLRGQEFDEFELRFRLGMTGERATAWVGALVEAGVLERRGKRRLVRLG